MKTLINFELDENELCELFSEKRQTLVFDSIIDKLQITKLSNGLVYYYSGIYAIGGVTNKIFQIVIKKEGQGIILIDTKRIRGGSKLIIELGMFLTTLHDILVDPTNKDLLIVDVCGNHTVADFREQILINNSTEIVIR